MNSSKCIENRILIQKKTDVYNAGLFYVWRACIPVHFVCLQLIYIQSVKKQENLFIYVLTKSVTNFIIYMFMLVFSNPFL